MFDTAWTTTSGPPQHNMFTTPPQNWPYVSQVAVLDTSGYLGQLQDVYQNPYVSQWPPAQSTYTARPSVAQAAYSSVSGTEPCPSQLITTQGLLHNLYNPEQNTSTDDRRALAVSPTTTSTSMSSTVAGWSATAPPDLAIDLPYVCSTRVCGRAYKRKAELDRHHQEKHGPTLGRLLCPVKLCPRSIPSEGFDRMSHLTQHLRSGKHKMSAPQAKFEAREHNPRKVGRNS